MWPDILASKPQFFNTVMFVFLVPSWKKKGKLIEQAFKWNSLFLATKDQKQIFL